MSHPNEVVHMTKYHDEKAPVHSEAAPVKHTAKELEALHKQEQDSNKTHTHLPDGSILPEVKFCFVFPTLDHAGRVVPLHGDHDNHLRHELLQYFAKPSDIVKGGFFVTAEQKSWSNETTVDEPWMIESYFKALLPILHKKDTKGVAYPFWPKATSAGGEAVEAKVHVHLVPGHETALELEHEDKHCCVKVSTRRIKVSLKSFVSALIREAEELLKFMALLDAKILGEATMKKFPNPNRLAAYLDEMKTLI